jgi:hypothetical protein
LIVANIVVEVAEIADVRADGKTSGSKRLLSRLQRNRRGQPSVSRYHGISCRRRSRKPRSVAKPIKPMTMMPANTRSVRNVY